jgi:chemosensory pili system protein ChpA (sensor histidine kinase/response regulator)
MTDDGAGVPLEAVRRKAIKRGLLDPQAQLSDHEILQFILRPGFSTAEKITQISGRGLGMDVVHEEVKQLGGSMSIESSPGKGARFDPPAVHRVGQPGADGAPGRRAVRHPAQHHRRHRAGAAAELEACYRLDPPRYTYAGHDYELRYLGELLQGVPARAAGPERAAAGAAGALQGAVVRHPGRQPVAQPRDRGQEPGAAVRGGAGLSGRRCWAMAGWC